MDALYEPLFRAMESFRKSGQAAWAMLDISHGEFFLLKRVDHLTQAHMEPIYVSSLQAKGHKHMSLPAISQALNALETKGYLTRTMSGQDRRKISVALTPAGEDCLRRLQTQMDTLMREVAQRFGEEEMRRFTGDAERLAAVVDQVRREMADQKEEEKQA